MKDYFSYKKIKHNNIYFLIFYLSIFIYKIENSFLSDCSIESPIKQNGGDCIIGGCSLSLFESGECTIENDIIRTQ